jgi:hypothetical protein
MVVLLTACRDAPAPAPREYAGIQHIAGDLVIERTALEVLSLPDLESVGGDVRIWENAQLTRIELPRLAAVGGELSLYDDPALASLDGLSALATVGGTVRINRLPELSDLTGLESLSAADGLYLFHDTALTSLDGLEHLTDVGRDVSLWELPALASAELPAIEAIGGRLDLFDTDALVHLAAPVLGTLGSYELHHADRMTGVGTFPALASVPDDVTIKWNAALVDLSGLALASAGAVVVQENHALAADEIDRFLAQVTVEDPVVAGNLGAPQAPPAVLDHGPAPSDFYDDWRTVEEFEAHLRGLETPGLAAVIELGRSVEDRPILGLLLGTAGRGTLVTGLEHAREWIGGVSAMYLAERLLRDYGTDPVVTAILDAERVLVVPVSNPDGYRHTWTTDRFWRKNRRDNEDGHWGVDLNRNWSYGWGLDDGSHAATAGLNYRGPAPFSEPEVEALRVFLRSEPGFDRYVDLHSTGQVALHPWGYTGEAPADLEALDSFAWRAADALRTTHGTPYDAGQTWHRLYPASGTGTDWCHGDHGMLAVLFELRDRGEYGFLLPPSHILPVAEEVWAAVSTVLTAPEVPRLWVEVPALNAGSPATITAWRADPGVAVVLVASLTGPGVTSLPAGDVELADAAPLGTVDADGEGAARFSFEVPAVWAGRTVWFQAVAGSRPSALASTAVP